MFLGSSWNKKKKIWLRYNQIPTHLFIYLFVVVFIIINFSGPRGTPHSPGPILLFGKERLEWTVAAVLGNKRLWERVCLLGILSHYHFSEKQRNGLKHIWMVFSTSQNFNMWQKMTRDDKFRRRHAGVTRRQSSCCLDPRKLSHGAGLSSACILCLRLAPATEMWQKWNCLAYSDSQT